MMKTIIKFKDGTSEEIDGAPSIDVEAQTMVIVDEECLNLTDDVSLDSIEEVVFRP
jgi:hypothetical protein